MYKKSLFIFLLWSLPCISSLAETDLNFKNQRYFIKKDYVAREEYVYYDDTANRDECQEEVYVAAFDLFLKERCRVVVDVGCGSAFKLMKYFKDYQTIGFDVSQTLPFLKSQYPERQWYLSDFSMTQMNLPEIDLIICADVIEHLLDPDQLLNWIRKLNFKYLVISTPDRELLPGVQGNKQCLTGPPQNPKHIREWSFGEFERYMAQYFDVVARFHTKKEWWGQVIVATKKQ
ncbi:hypothetical protein CVU75_00835 [Candidatus Dependentiae bacterium HGW-Dependentiae-1]|nr:MAG: hypothetical protein CVU75_00835 [Candidatus Dependentiae bacterium HGW-Dependentiae-1]